MKVLYIHNNPVSKSKANMVQVIQMCRSFDKITDELILAIPSVNQSVDEVRKLIRTQYGFDPKFKIVLFSKYKLRLREFLYFEVSKILKIIKPDLCITRKFWAAKKCIDEDIPVIYESHDATMRQRWKILNKFETYTLIKISKHIKFLKLITISKNLKQYWLNIGIDQTKLLALHDGFSPELFKQESGENFKKDLSFPEEKKIVTYTGSLYGNRNINVILQLANQFREVQFLIVGGPQKHAETLLKKCREKKIKNVRIEGPVDHHIVPKYLYASDVLLALWSSEVPTIDYCSPLKLFEYMASGKKIVAHNFPTIKEVLQDGYSAIMVEPDSFESLKEGLNRALYVENGRIGTNARIEAYQKYTWDKRAEQIISSLNVEN